MATLLNVYFTKDKIDTIKKTLDAKGAKGLSLTMAISDTANDYGQNVTAYVTQSKEEREAKTPKYYVGNGAVFWNEGQPLVITKQAKDEVKSTPLPPPVGDDSSDLPF